MDETLVTFQKFIDPNLAEEVAVRLQGLGIYCVLENNTAPFDVTFAYNPLTIDIRLKLYPSDFAKANAALDEYYKIQLDTVDKDYYLLQFTTQELEEIMAKPDEWGRFDYQLAQKLLKERGNEIQPAEAEILNRKRIKVLAKGESAGSNWVEAGYIFAALGGLVGIIIGLGLTYAKKTLPDGQRVFVYRQEDRDHGTRIVIIAFISLLIWGLFGPGHLFSGGLFFRNPY